MNINLLPFTVLWIILTAVVIGLLAYRRWVSKDEDDTLHVMDIAMAQKLESIDHWGKALTVIALVYGLAVGCGYLYQSWVSASEGLLK